MSFLTKKSNFWCRSRLISIAKSLAYLMVGWLFVGANYSLAPYFQTDPVKLTPSFIDHAIPFSEHAAWAYLSFFIIIPICFLCASYKNVRWMSFSFMGSGLLAGICFVVFPTMIEYVAVTTPSISTDLYNKIVATDVELNCFPSLHVALTVIVVWGAINKQHWLRTILLMIWGVVICISIIQLRRHLFLDLMGGFLLAVGVGIIVRYCLNKLGNKSN